MLCAASMTLSLTSCEWSGSGQSHNGTKKLDTLYHNQYAERFEILGSGDSILLRVHNPWQGASGVSMDYWFPKMGERAPRIICMSSSHVAYLDALGATDNIVGASGINYMTNKKLHLAETPDIGYDNSLNYEIIVALKPDYLFVYEVSGENSSITQKLVQLGIPVIYIADYLEQTPLARSEWIIAFGAIMGRSKEAQEIFNDIAMSYETIKAKVDSTGGARPKIMLNAPYRDIWYVPGDRSYIVQLINDAGGDYMAKGVDNDISRPISSEIAYEMVSKADIWLNPGTTTTLREVKVANPRFSALDVVSQGEIYNNNARSTPQGGSDFWESGTLRADIVLQDLVMICHPKLFPNKKLYYFHRLK